MGVRDHIEDISARFLSGETMQEIATRYGVTRERIRQLLAERGIDASGGGYALRSRTAAAKRATDAKASKDARAMKTFGCSWNELISLNEGRKPRDPAGLALCFVRKRLNARRDGAEVIWTLTFPEFIAAWNEAGLTRGRSSQSAAVVLIDPAKGYVAGNVKVIPYGEFVSAMRHREWATRRAGEAA